MGPAVLIALQSLTTPAWFPPACEQAATPSYALAEIHDSPRRDAAVRNATLWIDDDGIWVRDQDLAAWTPQPPSGATLQKDDATWHNLAGSQLPYRFDTCLQTLWISPPRGVQNVDFGTVPSGGIRPALPSGFLNLDFVAAEQEGTSTQYAGLTDIGLASGFSSLRGAWGLDNDNVRRLDSYFTYDDPASLHRLRIGDGITRSDLLGTPVRYGGIRWGTDFSLQPEVPRFALPSVHGEAALPSTLELYVDGALRGRTELDPGPFTILNPPVYTGDGNMQLVVRDALGRETLYAQPFYISTQLLTTGTADYAMEVGKLRQDFAQPGDRYDDTFGLGTYRYGLTDSLTAGGRLEVQQDARTVGASTVYAVPAVGQFSAGLAGSDGQAGTGGQMSLGFERIGRRTSFGAQGNWGSPEYVELGRTPGAVARALRAQLGFSLPTDASVSLAWAEEIRRDTASLSLTAVSYNQRVFRNWYGTASWLHSPNVGNTTILSLSRPVGIGQSLSIQFEQDPDHNRSLRLTWQYSPRGPLGWSYLASTAQGKDDSYNAIIGYAGERGSARISGASSSDTSNATLDASSGFAWVGSDIYWTRPVQDSFVVVDAASPGVRIFRDNQPVGTTGSNGRMLVPDVLAYVPTRISLEPQDLPMDRSLLQAFQDLKHAPGGNVITLAEPAKTLVQAHLHLDNGQPVPAGAAVRVNGEDAELPVGHEGLVYLETTAKSVTIEASWGSGTCRTGSVKPSADLQEIKCTGSPQ